MKSGRAVQESVLCRRPSACPGLEVLRATYVTQRFSKHFHEGYALGCIERGALGFRYQGEHLLAGPGQVNLSLPGEVHDGAAAAPTGWTYSMLYFPAKRLESAARELKLAAPPHFRRAVLDDPELAQGILKTHQMLACRETPALAKQSALLELLIFWISRHAEPNPTPGPLKAEHGLAKKVRDLIEDRFSEDLSLAELAAAAGLSAYHLIRIFRQSTGLTPHAYLTQTRLSRARQELHGPARLADLAAWAGFCDQGHFTRLFKRRFGLTPAAYRNFLQNN